MLLPSLIQIDKLQHFTGHTAAVFALECGQLPNTVLSGGGDGVVAEWRLDEHAPAKGLARVNGNIFSLLFLEDKKMLCAGDLNGVLHITDLVSKQELKQFTYVDGAVYCLQRFNANIIVAGCGNGNAQFIDIDTLTEVRSLEVSDKAIRSLLYIEASNELLFACSDFNIYVYDATNFTLKHVLNGHDNSVFAIALNNNGTRLVSGSRDAGLRVWDVENGYKQLMVIPAHMYTINDIVFSPDGRLMATAGRDKHIKIWDAENFNLLKVIDFEKFGGHINSVNKLFWSNWNNCLISCGDDRAVLVWDIKIQDKPSD